MFPLHVRLSIHAHKNGGPKFGINLLSKEKCKSIESLNADMSSQSDFLHIPTPWHNSVVRIEGDKNWYVAKSKAVTDALRERTHTGQFFCGAGTTGGYYRLKNVSRTEDKPSVSNERSAQSPSCFKVPSLASFDHSTLELRLRKWSGCVLPLTGVLAVVLLRFYYVE